MNNNTTTKSTYELSIWGKNLLGLSIRQIHTLLPGFLVASLLAWVSTWLSKFIGISLMGFEKTPVSAVMMAILLGLIISNLIPLPAFLKPGLTFTVKKVLRLGIIFLGIRLSIIEVFRLGTLGIPIVLATILGALIVTTLLNKWLKLPERLGTLIAVGTAICGVSAIVATGPAIDAREEEVTYAVAVITIFGILATLMYPYMAHMIFSGNPVQAGLFLGTSVHDTSQVTGAALVYAEVFAKPRTLDVATVTKLVRNVFMVAVIPFMAFYYAHKVGGEQDSTRKAARIGKLFPLFIVGFLICAILRSIGDFGVSSSGEAFGLWDSAAWKHIHSFIKNWAVNFLVVALAGVGLSTRFRILKGLGIKPFIVGLCAALIVGVVSVITISLLGTFVVF